LVATRNDELPPPDVNWFRPQMLAAVVARDFATIYRQLQKIGFTQQRIGEHTKQSQPEVSAIIHGRKVLDYYLIKRIISRLGIPPCLAGLGTCCCHNQCPHHPRTPPR
jgi:hypothetical protein